MAGLEAMVEEMEAHSRSRRSFSTSSPSRDHHHPGPIVARGEVVVLHRGNLLSLDPVTVY
jgi:hypothetical protein